MANEEDINQFMAITDAPRHIAEHVISAHGPGNLDAAISFYLDSGGVGHGTGYPYSAQLPEFPPLQTFAGIDQEGRPGPPSHPIVDIAAEEEGGNDDEEGDYVKVPRFPQGIDDDMEGPSNLIINRRVRRNRPRRAAAPTSLRDELQELGHSFSDDDALEDSMLSPSMAGRRANTRRSARRAANRGAIDPLNSAGEGEDQDVDQIELPDDVNVEEQRMLMAALTGQAYTGQLPSFDKDDQTQEKRSAGAMEREQLRLEQDAAYYESLAADQRKEEEARRQVLEEEEMVRIATAQAQLEESRREEEARALHRRLSEKEAALPEEPPQDLPEVVTILIRLPGGGRVGRRFKRTDMISSLFDFVDVSQKGGDIMPGGYRLIRQYPRKVYEAGTQLSLSDADLVHSQEALFVEML